MVRGICDWDLGSLKAFSRNPEVVRELHLQLRDTPECRGKELMDFSQMFLEATVAECFQPCMDDINANIKQRECSEWNGGNASAFFEDLLRNSSACAEQMPDTLEGLVDFMLQTKCLTWYPPSPLWIEDDKPPKSVAHLDYRAVCQVYHGVEDESRDPADLIQRGSCPEGTTCSCPQTWAISREPTPLYRSGDRSFVQAGSAELPSLISSFSMGALTRTMTRTLPQAIAAGTLARVSISTVLLSPAVLLASGMGVASSLWTQSREWKCKQTAGCWPARPRKMVRKCRVPDSAQSGGSPVWFLPPPGLRMQHRGWLRGCRLTKCVGQLDREDGPLVQQVGFGGKDKRDIFNCQPLTFENMSVDQRRALLEALTDSGIPSEYDLAKAWALVK